MNKIYKLVWNNVRGCYVVAGEFAKAHGRSARRAVVGAFVAAAMVSGMGVAEATIPEGTASGNSSIAIGAQSSASNDRSIAIGNNSSAGGEKSIAIGYDAKTESDNSSSSNGSIAMGSGAFTFGIGLIAIGQNAVVASNPDPYDPDGPRSPISCSIALGYDARVTTLLSVAIGSSSRADGFYSTAIGNEAVASHFYSVALGAFSKTERPNSVAVGGQDHSGKIYRQITGVAAGTEDHDAVNLAQLKDAIAAAGAVKVDGQNIVKGADGAINLSDSVQATLGQVANKADKSYVDTGLGKKANVADVYTKTETDSKLDTKADKATTLAGYGITDAYTKGEAIGMAKDVVQQYEIGLNGRINENRSDIDSILKSIGSHALGDAKLEAGKGLKATYDDTTGTYAIGIQDTIVDTFHFADSFGKAVDINANGIVASENVGGLNNKTQLTENGLTLTQNDKSVNIKATGIDMGGSKITNVGNGTLSANSGDAVNGSQLYATNMAVAANSSQIQTNANNIKANQTAIENETKARVQGDAETLQKANAYTDQKLEKYQPVNIDRLEQKINQANDRVNRVGATAAALAAINYQPMAKGQSQIAVGMGGYKGKQATALGFAYQINDRVSGAIAGSASGEERMFNIGFNYLFGQHSNKDVVQQTVVPGSMTLKEAELQAEVDSVKADNAAMKAHIAKQDAKMAELEALVKTLVAKQ